MPLFQELDRFLVANGVDPATARQATAKLQANARGSGKLNSSEIALAEEFLSRGTVRADPELTQLVRMLDLSRAGSRPSSRLADKSSRGVLADKSSRDVLASKFTPGALADKSSRDVLASKFTPGTLADKWQTRQTTLRPADIRQLAVKVARS